MKKIILLFITFFCLQTQAQCWKQIDGGGYFVLGIKDDGTLWGWGKNYNGVIGDSPEDTQQPFQISPDADWDFVTARYW